MLRLFVLIAALWGCLLAVSPGWAADPTPVPAGDLPNLDRVVSLGGCVSETLVALGFRDRLVGVDATSTHPAELAKLPQLGYHRQISAEGVLSLAPTLVLGTSEAGPSPAIEQLEAARIDVRLLPAEPTLEGACAMIREVGRLTQRPDEARALVATIDQHVEQVHMRTHSAPKPRVLFIYARGGGTMNVAGEATKSAELIRLAGGVNAADGFEGYRPLTSEALVAARPDVLFLLDKGLEAMGGEEALLAVPGVSLTPAGRDRRIVHLDDQLALGFGPRLGEGIVALARALHPGRMASYQ